MIRRTAYDKVGGFSNFFLHRCTMNEDVDLGLRLTRVGRIVFCPSARMGHFQTPGGRLSPMNVAEDELLQSLSDHAPHARTSRFERFRVGSAIFQH